jgi:hypothetical protein
MIQNALEWYGSICHIQDFIKQYDLRIMVVLLVLSFGILLIGLKIYRYIFSCYLFFGTILIACLLFPHSKWIYVVAGFSVIGVCLAVIGFHWKIAGLVVYSAVQASIGFYLLFHNPILTAVAAIIAGIVTFFLPIITSLVMQIVGNGTLLYYLLQEIFPKAQIKGFMGVTLIMAIAILGAGLQKYVARDQRVLDVSYLERFRKKEKSDERS